MPDPAPHLAALDARRAGFLAALADIPEAQRRQPPAMGAWSPLQIGEHLLLTEEMMAHFMDRQIQAGDARRDVGKASEKSVEGLLAWLRTPAKTRMPADARGIDPQGELGFDALRERWAAVGERWHGIAETLPPELAGVALLRHPVGGPMQLDHTLRFLEAHAEHHEHQLARTVAALRRAAEA